MRVYVAGTWEYRVFVRELMNVLERAGHEIAVDWTRHVPASEASSYAEEDMLGVKTCEAFVLVDPKTPSKGKFTELGMAIAWNKRIAILLDDQHDIDCLGVFGHLKGRFMFARSFHSVLEVLEDWENANKS